MAKMASARARIKIRSSRDCRRRLYSATLISFEACLGRFHTMAACRQFDPDRRGKRNGLPREGGKVCAALLALGLLVCAFSAGCVQRRMTVRTDPPGALLYVDDYEIGTTPASVSFTYYGTRKIRIVKDGYETLTVMQPIPTPWYEFFPVDFIAENFVPGQIHDQRTIDFHLQPQTIVPTGQLLARAEELRRGAHAAAAPLPGADPANAPPLGGAEVVPAPEGVGGQPVHTLPPR